MVGSSGAALEYDLMTRTGRTLSEYEAMGAAGTVALVSFYRHLGPDSATWRAEHPDDELPPWTERAQTNAMLADIYDAVAHLAAITAAHGTGRRVRKVDPYPRPNSKNKNTRRIGSEPVKASGFAGWWERMNEKGAADGGSRQGVGDRHTYGQRGAEGR